MLANAIKAMSSDLDVICLAGLVVEQLVHRPFSQKSAKRLAEAAHYGGECHLAIITLLSLGEKYVEGCCFPDDWAIHARCPR